jgi:hypothetical protein
MPGEYRFRYKIGDYMRPFRSSNNHTVPDGPDANGSDIREQPTTRLPLDDLWLYEITDATYLGNFLVRFRCKNPPEIPQFLTSLAEGHDEFVGSAEDRRLKRNVERRYRSYRKDLQRCFESFGSETKERFRSWDRLFAFNIKHIYRPDFIYTNGQKVITQVDQESETSLVLHSRGVEDIFDYHHDFSSHGYSFDEAGLLCEHDPQGVESTIQKYLGELFSEEMSMTDGVSERAMQISYARSAFVARMGQVEHVIPTRYGSYLMNELRGLSGPFQGFVPKCCATCMNLRVSGMSLQMSNGTKAYCDVERKKRQSDWYSVPEDLVHALYSCPDYELNKGARKSIAGGS